MDGAFGGGHYQWPDGGGAGHQPAILVAAFRVIENKVAEIRKAMRGKKP